MPDCHVIIVNWNGGPLAVDSARSVAQQSLPTTLWLVDNASQDGSCEAVAQACPSTRVIRNASNLGFAAGNNQALRAAGDADYVFLINNDVVLPNRHSLADVIDYLRTHPEVQGACGRYEYPSGEFQRFYNRLPTALNLAAVHGAGRYCRSLRLGRATRDYFMLDDDFTVPMTIEQPAFACVLMRGENLRLVGLLDEQFPIFFNDVDICWRWREKGYVWQYLPDWRIVHHKSQSTSRLGGRLGAELAASAVRFARKHFAPSQAFLVRMAVSLDICMSRWRRGQRTANVLQVWRGEHFFGVEP